MAEDLGLLAGMDADGLARRVHDVRYADLWQRLTRRTNDVLRAVREAGLPSLSYGSLGWHSITPMVREAALLWRMTGDVEALAYVEACVDVVDRASRDPATVLELVGGKPPANSHGEIALATDLCREGLSDACREKLLCLMRDVLIDFHRGEAPYVGHAGGGNIPYCQTVNAALCALTWGAACGHPMWEDVLHHAIEYTRCYLAYGCDDGGFGYEGTGYSHEVFHFLYLLAQLCHQSGRIDLFAEEPRMRAIVEGSLQLAMPGGSFLVNINDHGLLMPRSMAWLLYTAAHYKDPLHLGLWYAYQGPTHPVRPYGDVMPWYREHYLPGPVAIDESAAMLQAFLHWDPDAAYTPLDQADRPTTVYSPGTETAVLRTSWSTDAVAVHLPGAGRSHASQTHRHADCGHFCIWAHGEYLAIDTGRYNVDEDQHSVVLVDGKCHMPSEGWGMSHRAGRKADVALGPMCCHLRADAALMKDCNWADRHFLFVPLEGDECYLVVIDSLNKDNSTHRYRWQLQCNPACEIHVNGDHEATVTGAHARLDLSFMCPGVDDVPSDPHQLRLSHDEAEWAWPYGPEKVVLHRDTGLMVTSFVRPRLLADVTGPNGQLMTVIVPRRKSAPSLVVRSLPQKRLLQAQVTHALGTDVITAALDHGYIRTPAVEALSRLVVVRRDVQGHPAGTWSLDGECRASNV